VYSFSILSSADSERIFLLILLPPESDEKGLSQNDLNSKNQIIPHAVQNEKPSEVEPRKIQIVLKMKPDDPKKEEEIKTRPTKNRPVSK